MRNEREITDRLVELHGEDIQKEMGGLTAMAEANALLWVLGVDEPVTHSDGWGRGMVDVSAYLDDVDGDSL